MPELRYMRTWWNRATNAPGNLLPAPNHTKQHNEIVTQPVTNLSRDFSIYKPSLLSFKNLAMKSSLRCVSTFVSNSTKQEALLLSECFKRTLSENNNEAFQTVSADIYSTGSLPVKNHSTMKTSVRSVKENDAALTAKLQPSFSGKYSDFAINAAGELVRNTRKIAVRTLSVFFVLMIALAFSSKSFAATRTWGGTTGTTLSWTNGANWGGTAPVAGDDIIFNTAGTLTFTTMPGSSVAYNSITINAGTITFSGGSNITFTLGGNAGIDFTIASGASLTLNTGISITLASNATASIAGTLTVNSGRTYNTDGNSVVTTVAGTIVNAGTVTCTTATKLLFNTSGATYQHSQDGGALPTATWNAASNCNITGVTGNVPTVGTFAQSFGNFAWNCASQTADLSLVGNLTTINGTFTIANTNTGSLRLSNGGVTATLAIGVDFIQTGGTFYISGTSSSNTWTVNVIRNFSLSGGTLNMNGVGGTTTLNVSGNLLLVPAL